MTGLTQQARPLSLPFCNCLPALWFSDILRRSMEPSEAVDLPGATKFPHRVLKAAEKIPNCPVCYDSLVLPGGDDASLASALMPWHVIQVVAFWKMLMGSNSLKRVLDLSANVGCDALLMASMGFDEIASIEISKARFECLVCNIAAMGFEKLITPIYGNCIAVINGFPEGTVFDAIYLDPPWLRDGEKYNPRRVFEDLYLIAGINPDGTKLYVSIFDVMADIFKKGLTNTIVLKVPPSVKFSQLSDRAKKGNVPIMGIRGGKFAEYRLIAVHPDDLIAKIAKSM